MTRILLVDDVELFLELERTFLKRFGCEILTARTGPEALQKARTRRPDAVLLDVVMPGMSGYEVCRALKDDPGLREVPVLFVAAEPDPDEVARAGGDGCVRKPVTRASLLTALRRHLPLVERASPRAPAALRVRLEDARRQERKLTSKDLSQDGIFLRTEQPLPVGSSVDLHFRLPLPEGPEEVHLRGEVVRQVEADPASYLIPGIGVRFVKPDASARMKMGRFVRERLAVPA
jgi:uncharacterized protein (TIGR02266 family)